MQVGIVDYGMGNLRSVQWAFERIGVSCRWIRSADDWRGDDQAVIVPGVGAFGLGVQELEQRQLIAPISEWLQADRPFLGICLGFQFLFEASSESPNVAGFARFPGVVEKLTGNSTLKVPQIGWNHIDIHGEGPLRSFDGRYFYFVHSFAAPATAPGHYATTEYGRTFVSAAIRGRTWGTQFHPERSGRDGLAMLTTFVEEMQ